jgi:hypothetical protein
MQNIEAISGASRANTFKLALIYYWNTCTYSNITHYAWADVGLVVFPVNNAVAPATQITRLPLPTPDALTRSGDYETIFNGAFRAFFVLGSALTSWRFGDLPYRTT